MTATSTASTTPVAAAPTKTASGVTPTPPRGISGTPPAPGPPSTTTQHTAADTTAILNTLLETCRDSSQGFTSAAGSVKDPAVRQTLTTLAEQRRAFCVDLEHAVTALAGTPATTGHGAGTMHRGWMNLKVAVASHDTHAILEECERGEDYARTAFADALAEGVPETVRPLISRQSQAVTTAHQQVRTLRDQWTKAPDPAVAGEKAKSTAPDRQAPPVGASAR